MMGRSAGGKSAKTPHQPPVAAIIATCQSCGRDNRQHGIGVEKDIAVFPGRRKAAASSLLRAARIKYARFAALLKGCRGIATSCVTSKVVTVGPWSTV